MFPLCIPEMPAGFKSYIAQLIPQLFRLDPVTTAVWLVSFGLIILSILHLTMGSRYPVFCKMYCHLILASTVVEDEYQISIIL
jgi:hypothetical protein